MRENAWERLRNEKSEGSRVPKDHYLDEVKFKSLVTAEEIEAIKQVRSAVEHLLEVHGKSCSKLIKSDLSDVNAKQMVHQTLYMDMIADMDFLSTALTNINTTVVVALTLEHKRIGKTYNYMLAQKAINQFNEVSK